MRLAWGIDQPVADYIASKFAIAARRGGFKPHVAVGIVNEENTLCGGIVMTDWRIHDACLSIYVEPPAFITPRMFRELFGHVFGQMRMKRVTAEIAKKNRRARRFVEGIGFRLEGTLRHGWHDGRDDMCIYGMTFDACKWLETT